MHITAEDAVAASSEARGIFRVWTVGRGGNEPGPEASFTVAALAGRAAYDPLTEDPALSCIAQGMPVLMDNPFPDPIPSTRIVMFFCASRSGMLRALFIWTRTVPLWG